MTATQKIEKLNELIITGKTVYVHTMTRITKVTPSLAKRFANAGHPVFKAQGNSMMMISGNSYVSIDFCKITYQ